VRRLRIYVKKSERRRSSKKIQFLFSKSLVKKKQQKDEKAEAKQIRHPNIFFFVINNLPFMELFVLGMIGRETKDIINKLKMNVVFFFNVKFFNNLILAYFYYYLFDFILI
jgi:hypothetical protein